MQKHDLIFVYGTLMRGQANGLDLNPMARFVAEDFLSGSLYKIGWYPGFVPNDDGLVMGEVFEILDENLSSMLDAYEGYPWLFDREQIKTLDNRLVWVYIYQSDLPVDSKVPSGSWKEACDA